MHSHDTPDIQRHPSDVLFDILDHTPAALLLVSLPEFRILAINARACARFGIRISAEIVGQTCATVIPRFIEDGISDLWLSAAGVHQSDRAASATLAGNHAVRRWSFQPIREPDGSINRLLLVRFEAGETPEQQLANSTQQITHALISTLERDQLLDLILVQLHGVVAYDSATIILRDEDGYYVAAGRGLPEREARDQIRFEVSESLLHRVETETEPIILRDTAEVGITPYHWGVTRGWVGIPLRAQGEVVGVLTLESQTPNRYTRADAARAQAFAAYAALAVRNAEIYRRAREQSARLAFVGKIARAITATHDLRAIFTHLIDHLRDAVALDFAELALLNQQNKALDFVARYPELAESAANGATYSAMDLTDLQRIIAAGQPAALALDATTPDSLLRRRLALLEARSCIIVPIVADQSALGVLVLASHHPRAFPQLEILTLADLAQHLAVAIQNAQLHQMREQALADLRVAQQRLVQSERLTAVGELVAGVAHELNNPLTAVLGFASILQQTAPDDIQDDLALIVEGATRARRIVQNLLTFARQREAHLEEVDLNMTVRQVMSLLAYQMRTNGINIEERLSPQLPITVADATAIKQVLLNLLNNAMQALAKWPGTREILVSTGEITGAGASRLLLEVSDSGPGIAPEHLSLVFEPFFTTKPIGEGTGLGLSICYGIVKQYNGDIRVRSRPGEGATFSVELPVYALEAAPPDSPLPLTEPERTQRLLVIDDEQIVTTLITRLLREQGFEVDDCHDSMLALDLIARADCDYDLIISDIRMPTLSGEQLYEELSRRAPHLVHRLLFISGDTASHGTRDFLERTGARCVEKPFETAEFLAVVRHALSSPA